MNRTNYFLALCLAAGLLAAVIAALMGRQAAQEWQAQAEADHADWLDEMNTRESVRPI